MLANVLLPEHERPVNQTVKPLRCVYRVIASIALIAWSVDCVHGVVASIGDVAAIASQTRKVGQVGKTVHPRGKRETRERREMIWFVWFVGFKDRGRSGYPVWSRLQNNVT